MRYIFNKISEIPTYSSDLYYTYKYISAIETQIVVNQKFTNYGKVLIARPVGLSWIYCDAKERKYSINMY
jgi:hypothetical protein